MPITELTPPVVLCLLSWVAVLIGMAANRAKGSGPAARRGPRSLVGFLVQALGFPAC